MFPSTPAHYLLVQHQLGAVEMLPNKYNELVEWEMDEKPIWNFEFLKRVLFYSSSEFWFMSTIILLELTILNIYPAFYECSFHIFLEINHAHSESNIIKVSTMCNSCFSSF